jgi:hypothetical protein
MTFMILKVTLDVMVIGETTHHSILMVMLNGEAVLNVVKLVILLLIVPTGIGMKGMHVILWNISLVITAENVGI